MPRARFIDPDITIDEEFASLPIAARLLFIYSLPYADDAGNIPRQPGRMKATMFMYDTDIQTPEIEEMIELLIERTMYVPYTFQLRHYINIRNFVKYQRPRHPCQPKHPLAPGQRYRYDFRKDGKWITKEVTADDWNSTLLIPSVPVTYRDSTLRSSGCVTAKEGRKGSKPLPTSPTPSVDALPPATEPGNGAAQADGPASPVPALDHTPLDYTIMDHLTVICDAEDLGIETTRFKFIETLKAEVKRFKKSATLMQKEAQVV